MAAITAQTCYRQGSFSEASGLTSANFAISGEQRRSMWIALTRRVFRQRWLLIRAFITTWYATTCSRDCCTWASWTRTIARLSTSSIRKQAATETRSGMSGREEAKPGSRRR